MKDCFLFTKGSGLVARVFLLGCASFFFSISAFDALAANSNKDVSNLKGVNVDLTLVESDFVDLERYGAFVLRVSFPRTPLMSLTAPFEENEKSFLALDRYVDLARKHRMKIVLDPHVFPGMSGIYSMRPTDAFWTESRYQDQAVKLWTTLAKRYLNDLDVIVGFDLLNEPSPPQHVNGVDRCVFLTEFYKRLISAVRLAGAKQAVVVEFPMALNYMGNSTNQMDAAQCVSVIDDLNIIYSFHMYDPGRFTHQGVGRFKGGVSLYKGKDRKAVRDYLRSRLEPVRAVEKKNNLRIFVGEFSASRVAGGEGDLYVEDLIALFNEYRWGWAYHSFREADLWDPEKSVLNAESVGRSSTARRMKLLSDAFRFSPTNQ